MVGNNNTLGPFLKEPKLHTLLPLTPLIRLMHTKDVRHIGACSTKVGILGLKNVAKIHFVLQVVLLAMHDSSALYDLF